MRELRIVDAPGSPRIADACGQWIFDLAASVFGAYDEQTGKRLIKEWFVMLPKKNFKSGLASSIMLTCLLRNWRQAAEFTILAPTVEVATNSFNPARDMVQYQDEEDDSELSDLIQVQTHIKTLTHREKNATLKVIAADANTAAGKKSVGTLVEELWLFGKQPKAKEMLREALGGLASRAEGFTIWITTQSDEPPAGVFKEKLKYARDVRDGLIHDPQFLPIIYEHPPEMVKSKKHLNLENLAMVNPNLGYSVDEEFLHREYRKAKQEGELSLIGFLSKHANVEMGMALRHDAWAGAAHWESSVDKSLTFDSILERSEVIVFGIDGGGLDDLLGLSMIGRERDTRKWLLWCHAWAHNSVYERRQDIVTKLQEFEKDGDLTLVERPGQDIRDLADYICRIQDAGMLPEKHAIGVDAAGIGDTIDELTKEGRDIVMDKIVAIQQGWKLNGAIKTAERKLAGGEFLHSGSALMAWCVSNAKVVQVGNAITINKQVSGSAKIDPLMATFDAVSLMMLNPAPANNGPLQMFTLG